jgi:GDP/UDP-N,N'-diacetylbacillosamine 2-epimerase (hydrolysing)
MEIYMKKVCVLTATRAEYGLLKNIIIKMNSDPEIDLRVAVTGMHLSPEFGLTYKVIEEDGIAIDKKIEIILSSDNSVSITKSMGLALISFAEYFSESKPDLLVVLGDRYETLAVCIAAMNERIPIAHLYGGEITEGAIDECIRHSITKMSYLHFTSTLEYRNRVIQLGEEPERVFNVGAMGVENSLNIPLMSKEELEKSISFKLDRPYAVVTFHPVTLETNSAEKQTEELLSACDRYPDMKFVFTKANSDAGGRSINQMLDEYAADKENAVVFQSLGMERYLSALKYSTMVIGNSSSGLVEAPSFHVPTVNIGDRQKGRLQADTIINCEAEESQIAEAIKKALLVRHKSEIVTNPYGDGKTSDRILLVIKEFLEKDNISLKKKFFDVKY